MKEFEFTLVATTKIVVEMHDNQTGFDALDKARAAMMGKQILIADDDGDPDYPLQGESVTGAFKVENIIVDELSPYLDSES